MVRQVLVLDRVLELPRLELQLHDRGPLMVICLVEHRPGGTCARVLVHGLDHRRAAPGPSAAAILIPIGRPRLPALALRAPPRRQAAIARWILLHQLSTQSRGRGGRVPSCCCGGLRGLLRLRGCGLCRGQTLRTLLGGGGGGCCCCSLYGGGHASPFLSTPSSDANCWHRSPDHR